MRGTYRISEMYSPGKKKKKNFPYHSTFQKIFREREREIRQIPFQMELLHFLNMNTIFVKGVFYI